MLEIKKCVLIDDDTDDHELFSIAVRSINPNIKCQFAYDGCEGLELLEREKNNPPDCIFLDLNMPKMGGKECLSEIKKQGVLRDIPVVIFSTSSHPEDSEEAKSLGAAAFMTKPYRTSELTAMLKDFFNSYNKHT